MQRGLPSDRPPPPKKHVFSVRIPTKSASHSDAKSASHSDTKSARDSDLMSATCDVVP